MKHYCAHIEYAHSDGRTHRVAVFLQAASPEAALTTAESLGKPDKHKWFSGWKVLDSYLMDEFIHGTIAFNT